MRKERHPHSSSLNISHSSGCFCENVSNRFLRLVLYVMTVVHLSASSKYISVVLCVFLMPVIIFFKNLLFFRSVRSTPVFAQKSLGLHRRYLRNSQRNDSHRAGHRLLLSKSAKVHIPSVYTVIQPYSEIHHNSRRKKSISVRQHIDSSIQSVLKSNIHFTPIYKSIVYSFSYKVWLSVIVRAPIFNTTYLQNKPINI